VSAPQPGIAPPVAPAYAVVASPVSDTVMGELSPIARQVVAALRDSVLRVEVARAMKETSSASSIDLQDCAAVSVAQRLLLAGERNGMGSATLHCGNLRKLRGAILYMNPERLAHWDGTVIPIVTAIQNPDRALPKELRAYRSSTRLVNLSLDHPDDGPLLVVLPYVHPRRAKSKATTTSAQMVQVVPTDTARQQLISTKVKP
jgi:hypothetical protein